MKPEIQPPAFMTPASDSCQRWKDGADSWRHRSEGGFDQRRYEVHEIGDDTTAKAFVLRHHYAGSYGNAGRRYGLYDHDGRLVGVAVYGTGAPGTLPKAFPTLEPSYQSLELARFVLLDEVPANAESWFLARTFDQLLVSGVVGIVSFSDPVPRLDAHGARVLRGHVGTIYQASNAIYTGRGARDTLWLLPDGTNFDNRARGKIRRQEQGHAYCEARLVALGAPPLRSGEDPTRWLHDAAAEVGVRKSAHRGKHRYLFRLGRNRSERECIDIGVPALGPYPKRIDEVA